MTNESVTTGTETTATENQQTNQQTTTQETNSPTVEQLMAQLATAKADAEKYKTANDKLSKESADYKRQLRAKLSAEEQEAEAQKEAQRLADEERESLKKELNHIKAEKAYKTISDEKVVESLIDAVSDADHNAIAQIIENEKKKAVAEAESKWLKDRPRVNHGQYSNMTREQILAIPDRNEKLKAIAQNQHLF